MYNREWDRGSNKRREEKKLIKTYREREAANDSLSWYHGAMFEMSSSFDSITGEKRIYEKMIKIDVLMQWKGLFEG